MIFAILQPQEPAGHPPEGTGRVVAAAGRIPGVPPRTLSERIIDLVAWWALSRPLEPPEIAKLYKIVVAPDFSVFSCVLRFCSPGKQPGTLLEAQGGGGS